MSSGVALVAKVKMLETREGPKNVAFSPGTPKTEPLVARVLQRHHWHTSRTSLVRESNHNLSPVPCALARQTPWSRRDRLTHEQQNNAIEVRSRDY